MAKIFAGIMLALIGVYIGLRALAGVGLPLGMFTNEAEKVKAEAELKRVDVEMQERINDHSERMELIKAATRPRTPLSVHVLIGFLCVVCAVLFIRMMMERERRRFVEYRENLMAGNNREPLPGPKYTMVNTGEKFYDARDKERGGIC